MSLVVKVSINDAPTVAVLAATRMAGTTDPDSIGQYSVNAWHVPLGEPGFTPVLESASVEHRYGDGALELVKKMIAALPQKEEQS